MKDLLAQLETAPTGDRALSVDIFLASHETHYWTPTDINMKQLHSGPSKDRCVDSFICWEHSLLDASDIPDHATSLDAKVPEEQIVRTWMLGGFWHAEHYDTKLGKFFESHARTEILARRIASLKGIDAR